VKADVVIRDNDIIRVIRGNKSDEIFRLNDARAYYERLEKRTGYHVV
jgi:hypothetical protein